MNRIARTLCALTLATGSVVNAQSTDCHSLEVSGLTPETGTLMVALYSGADQFFKKPVWVGQVKVSQATQRMEVCGVLASEVAGTAFQDLNGNNKMDSNVIGIPTEPYGATGKPPKFSAPTWDTTKVSWPPAANTAVLLKM